MSRIDKIRPLAAEKSEPVCKRGYSSHAGAQSIVPDSISFLIENSYVIFIGLDIKDCILQQDYTYLTVLVGEPDGLYFPHSRTVKGDYHKDSGYGSIRNDQYQEGVLKGEGQIEEI